MSLRKGRTGRNVLHTDLNSFYPLYFATLLIRQLVIGPSFPAILIFRDWGCATGIPRESENLRQAPRQ